MRTSLSEQWHSARVLILGSRKTHLEQPEQPRSAAIQNFERPCPPQVSTWAGRASLVG
jgi:hypothetical protein